MNRKTPLTPLIALLLALSTLAGCRSRQEEPATSEPQDKPAAIEEAPAPPTPPIREDFEGRPRLSLFPRLGDFRPENEETERLRYWVTFMQHLTKTSGVIRDAGRGGGRALGLRSIKSIDSVAFFSPLAVDPASTYRVTFFFKGELPEGGTAGIGILEYDEFLWIGEQFTRSLSESHLTRVQEGLRLAGREDWQEQTLTFTTSDRTRMVHLVFFREGKHGREPVLFDDIAVEKVPAAAPPAAS